MAGCEAACLIWLIQNGESLDSQIATALKGAYVSGHGGGL